jgi:hypothetical protein
MGRTQDEYQPSLARFGIGLISLERDLVLGVRDTGTQVLLGEGGPVGAEDDALGLIFTGGACTAAWGAYKYESGSTVVVGSWERSSANGPCPAVGIGRTARVTLARPLGTRVVLDVASGLPLVPGLPIP